MIRKHLVGVALVAMAATAMAQDAALYSVAEGNKVDARTLAGWKAWRALNCESCHGKEQEGGAGPSLVESLKVLSKSDFAKVMLEGRDGTAMGPRPYLKGEKTESLYAYLKGRSDGKIAPGKVFPME